MTSWVEAAVVAELVRLLCQGRPLLHPRRRLRWVRRPWPRLDLGEERAEWGWCVTGGQARTRTRRGPAAIRSRSGPTQTWPKFGPAMGRRGQKNRRWSIYIGTLSLRFRPRTHIQMLADEMGRFAGVVLNVGNGSTDDFWHAHWLDAAP